MKFTYGTRPADPFYRRSDHPDATEVVVTGDGRVQRILGVYATQEAAQNVVDNLNAHSEFQIR